ncbi:MAG: UvrB/UvrC motif-containing protein [Streptosporangiaceae bacterium]
MRSLEVRIAQIRRDKEAAIDVQDFGQAAALRDAEKQLIEERTRVEQETAAGADRDADAAAEVGAVVGAEPGEGTEEPDELGRLRARVADLESRLREHGIDPDKPGEAPAATG